MTPSDTFSFPLGINGLGRIGKLTLWDQVARRAFPEIVVNLGRPAGRSLADIAHYIERDSTYGRLHAFLHGHRANPVISDLDEAAGTLRIDGVKVRVLREKRNPAEIGWGRLGVRLVVETTGKFLDPAADDEALSTSVRRLSELSAQEIMVPAAIVAQVDTAVNSVIVPMVQQSLNFVPVVREGRIEGVIGRAEILRLMVKMLPPD